VCAIKDNLKYGTEGLKLVEQIENKKTKTPSKQYLLKRKFSFMRINRIFFEETNDKKNVDLINQKLKLVYETLKDTSNIEQMHIDAVWEKYDNTKNPNEVYDSLNKKLQLYEKANAIKYITLYQKEIAGLFDRINLPSKMVEYDEKYLATTIKLKDTLAIIEAYLNTAHAHRYNHEPQKALEYSNKGLKIGAELEDHSLIDQVYFWQIGIYQSLKDYPKAIELAKKRYDWSLHVNNKFDAQQMAHLLARLNIDLNNYTNALKYVLIADTLLYKSNDLIALREGYRIKFEIYNRNKDFEKALNNHLKFRELDDSVQKRENHAGFEQKETIALFERNEAIKKEEEKKKDVIASKEKQQQKVILWFIFGGLILVATFSIMMFNRFRVTKKQNTIIGLQKQEVESQKHLVEEKQKEILDSIHYAKRLQEAILPPLHFINEHAPNNFVLYQPKDVVAGDFYWAEIKDDKFFIAAADSTGHGVPGAMVSVVCSNALNRTVNEFGITDTGKILDKTRELVLETFARGNAEVKDGMDISLLCIDKQNNKAFWSGANNPLWYVKSSVTSSAVEKSTDAGLDSVRPDIQLIEIKADKQPIGKSEITKPFTAHEIALQDGMQFYLFTDGFADQFGGPRGKKFMYKQLENLLISISHESMEIQKQKLEDVFKNWKGDLEQVDDVCVIGVKI